MTTAHDRLIERLTELGRSLEFDDETIVAVTLDRVAQPTGRHRPSPGPRRTAWLVAAGIVAIVAAVIVHPSGREAVARWFGLDGVSVEVDPAIPADEPDATFAVPGPGDSRVVVVDGRDVLVSAIDGRLDAAVIEKTVRSTDQITEVQVAGHPGLWIADGSHEVAYDSPVGDRLVTRLASNTLLWQDGSVLYRVEGFDDLGDALAFADGT